MTKVNVSVLLAAACLSGLATGAAANPVVLTNSTEVEAYNGNSATTGFFGGYWGSNIGSPTYNTPQATLSFVGDQVNIVFQTGFYTGSDTTYDTPGYGNVTVHAADIFIKQGGGSSLPVAGSSFFNYGISLGLDGADGGEGAGLYSIPVTSTPGTTYKTSTQIWGNRSQFYYGGAYDTGGAGACSVQSCASEQAAPTVLTGGVAQGGITVTTKSTPPVSGTLGTLEVQLTGTGAGLTTLENLFANNAFDIFWGTGDCSNAPIWGNVASLTHVPEPSSLALFATAAFGFRIMRRRKRKAPAVG